MNKGEFEERASLLLSGKGVIILFVVIFSLLSFTFGYYVGKHGREKRAEPVMQAAESLPAQQKQEQLPLPLPKHEEKSLNYISATGQEQEDRVKDLQKAAQPTETKPLETVKTGTAKKEHQRESSKEVKKAAKSPAQPPAKVNTAEMTYTVQLAALKSQSEAEAYKVRYEKKGFKLYIVAAKNQKDETIYKIRTGEFSEKKEAEMLSQKLKKTEGLSTFVTFKGE